MKIHKNIYTEQVEQCLENHRLAYENSLQFKAKEAACVKVLYEMSNCSTSKEEIHEQFIDIISLVTRHFYVKGLEDATDIKS